jgi:tRNA (mo5U34)-methyltransferase
VTPAISRRWATPVPVPSYPRLRMAPKGAEIEGIGEQLRATGKGSRWEQFRLPVELEGKTFLDVGCWEGVHCAEAVRRDAEAVLGIDLASSADLTANVERYGFEFLELDAMGERWLALESFDVVLCSGVLYSVESPMSLIVRLRAKTRELLVLETGVSLLQPDRPTMIFHGQGEGTANPSNWWTPNRLCLEQMLTTAGFSGISAVWEKETLEGYGRVCVHAVPDGSMDRKRLLPRKEKLMSIHGGVRGGGGARKSR